MVKKLIRIVLYIVIFISFQNFTFASTKFFPQYVDKNLFSGKWYEIARTYNSFQKNCKDSYVEYILNEQNYEIRNICTSAIDDTIINYNGIGKSAKENKTNFSKINMTYFYIFSKEYQVIYNDDYKYAVVSDDNFENIWIMSRNKNIDDEKLNEILVFLKKHINTEKLIYENRG